MSFQYIVLVTSVLALALAGGLYHFLHSRFGYGEDFPNTVYSRLMPSTSFAPETVVELDSPPGNIAVSRNGRIFFNFHPEYHPSTKIAELQNDKQWIPYPNVSFQNQVESVLSMRVDSRDRLWLLDYGHHGWSTPKLFAFHLSSDDDDMVYCFPREVAGFGSMLNDFNISPDGEYIYMADTSILGASPALIVFDVQRRHAHRLLSAEPALMGRSAFLHVKGHRIGLFGPLGMRINVDSLALSRDGASLYFSPLTGTDLLCMSTADIHTALQQHPSSFTLPSSAINSSLVRVVLQDKPATDGISTDHLGNVWMTALEHSSIALARRDRADTSPCAPLKTHNVITNTDLLQWPDGFSFGPGACPSAMPWCDVSLRLLSASRLTAL